MMIMIARTAISAATPPTDADLLARHLAEGLAVAAHREEEHDHVLDGAGEDDADDDPERAGQVAHLRREHRADERAGAGDRGEVVAEEHAAVGDVVVDRRCRGARPAWRACRPGAGCGGR